MPKKVTLAVRCGPGAMRACCQNGPSDESRDSSKIVPTSAVSNRSTSNQHKYDRTAKSTCTSFECLHTYTTLYVHRTLHSTIDLIIPTHQGSKPRKPTSFKRTSQVPRRKFGPACFTSVRKLLLQHNRLVPRNNASASRRSYAAAQLQA